MRVDISKVTKTYSGQKIRVEVTLPKLLKSARVSLWSATDGYQMAPYVSGDQLSVVSSMPTMVRPFYTTVEQGQCKVIGSFISYEDCSFVVRQDIDTAKDLVASSKIKIINTRWEKVISLVKNLFNRR